MQPIKRYRINVQTWPHDIGLMIKSCFLNFMTLQTRPHSLFMAALRSRCGLYIFVLLLSFFLSFFRSFFLLFFLA